MTETDYTYLKFVHFCNVQEWDVKRYNQQKLHFKSGILLNEILFPYKQNIERKEIISKKLQIIQKINFSGALFLRNFEEIKTYKGNLNIVPPNSLIYSKINIRHGCIYYNAIENKPFCVSSEYPVYTFDNKKVNGLFLKYLLQSNKFKELLNTKTSGISKARVKESEFLRIEIPFPPLSEQNALVTAYNAKMLQAAMLETQATETEANIENILFEMLGIKKAKTKKHDNKDGFLQMVRFKDITEWGVNLINKSYSINTEHINGKNLRLKDICSIGSGGTPSRSNSNYYKGNIPWVKTGEVLNDIINNTEEKITKEALDNSSAKIYPAGSLIIAMYGQGDTRGRTAKLGIEASTNQACAVLYNINRIVLVDYLWYYMQCNYHQLRSLASGNNQPNLNADKIKNYPVVIPPISIQDEIVTNISAQKEIIKAKKLQAEELRKEALTEFEKSIFE